MLTPARPARRQSGGTVPSALVALIVLGVVLLPAAYHLGLSGQAGLAIAWLYWYHRLGGNAGTATPADLALQLLALLLALYIGA